MTSRSAIPTPARSPEEIQAHLAAIVETSDDGIVSKDLNGVVQTWNAGAQRIFGYTAEEIIGRPITVLFPPDRLHEEDVILDRLRRGERVDHFQTVRVRKDGQPIDVSVTISPIRDGTGRIVAASKIVRDITHAVAVEGMYKAIVASSDDAIVSKNLDGIVQSWNAGAQRVFGYTAEEMIGKPIALLVPPERPNEEPEILERLKRGERVDHFETVRVRKDGRRIDVSVTISPIKSPTGRVVGASKVARDITANRQAAREREELLRREQLARAEAERVSRMKDDFLATLSHELRTPLNAILGWTHLLQNGGDTIDLRQGLDTIERNARHQTRLIEDLLDMSRIVSGKLRLDVRPVDLAGVIAEGVEGVRPAADAKNIALHPFLDATAGLVSGDPGRLHQVVWNLLTNAVKYTPSGGLVRVFLRRAGDSHVEVVVSDTGQGIRPEFLPHLFTRFAQADASTTRRHGGLGLGLAIVRHLVELHGGTVDATSPGEGRGSTFTLRFPLTATTLSRPAIHVGGAAEVDRHTTPDHPAHRAAAAPDIDLCGVKALVVDDQADSLELVRRLLEARRAHVLAATSAAEAMDVLHREQPDVLLSDIGMPDEDGYHLLARVRALPPDRGGTIPALALTAFARPEDRRRALMAGFQFHIAKPVEAAELVTAVANLTAPLRQNRKPATSPST